MNQAATFAMLGAGGLLLTKAVTGSSWGDILTGRAGQVPTTAPALSVAGVGAALTGAAATAGAGALSAFKGAAQALPAYTALTGPNANAWASEILQAIGAPATRANVSSMLAWFGHEGGGGQNNPLNTTLSTSGATGSINSVGVKNYGTVNQGVQATAQTLTGGYPAIVGALRAGGGLSNAGPQVSGELSTWSGGGYSSL